ncbi:MAG: hypothetical protein NZM11_09665 [Anaerolineales bacterium]|nr:hypothetical protein [Anaerolineales bacterium]
MLNTASFPSYVKSLKIRRPVTTRGGVMVAEPPPIVERIVRLGLGGLFLNTLPTKSILAHLDLDLTEGGVAPIAFAQDVAQRLGGPGRTAPEGRRGGAGAR